LSTTLSTTARPKKPLACMAGFMAPRSPSICRTAGSQRFIGGCVS
jgi:hypothetical protein